MSDSRKTKKELLAELAAVRGELEKVTASQQEDQPKPTSQFKGGMTRREAMTVWVAPVVLSIPLVARSAGAQGRSGGAVEGGFPTQNPTIRPTNFPTQRPTQQPTFKPTQHPTNFPTSNPTNNPTYEPTYEPTQIPTKNPTQIPTQNPTQAPIMSPTVAPTPAPFPTSFPTSAPTTSWIFADGFETGGSTQWSGTVSKASKSGATSPKRPKPRGRELVESGFPSRSKKKD